MATRTRRDVKLKPYPAWVCHECGMKARGRPISKWHVATFHEGKCGACGKIKDVTEPRDYGYPKFDGCKNAA